MKLYNIGSFLLVCILSLYALSINNRYLKEKENVEVMVNYSSFLEEDISSLSNRLDSLTNVLDNIHNLTWDNIDFWIGYFKISCDTVVRAQIILETGNLTSDILINGNNLFGMKFPKHRDTRALGEYKNHARYSNYIHSVEDYSLWQKYFGYDTIVGTDLYLDILMEHGYAEASGYRNSLGIIINNLRKDYNYYN